MSRSWLQRKRKGELIDLAQKASLPDADGYLKDDLVEWLEGRLNSNETTYAKHADFRDYYGRGGSPMKRERFSPVETVVSTKTRRQTLIEAPSEQPTPVRTAVTQVARTPRVVSHRVSEVINQVDFPASPAQLAEVADQQFQVAKAKASELWNRSHIDYFKELVRENASSVAAIQTLVLLIEAIGLQYNTLPTRPVQPAVSMWDWLLSRFETLLTSKWWAPATMWSLTSVVLPLICAYFFNLTLRSNTNRKSLDRQYPADPLTFNILKAILTYSAYHIALPASVQASSLENQSIGLAEKLGKTWGPFSSSTIDVVRDNVPGGYHGLQIGAIVGVLVSLYDATLKK